MQESSTQTKPEKPLMPHYKIDWTADKNKEITFPAGQAVSMTYRKRDISEEDPRNPMVSLW